MSTYLQKKIELLSHGYCLLYCQKPMHLVLKKLINKFAKDTDWMIDWMIEDVYKDFYNGFVTVDCKKYALCNFYWQFQIKVLYYTPSFEIGICDKILTGNDDDRVTGYYYKPFEGKKGRWISNEGGKNRCEPFTELYHATKYPRKKKLYLQKEILLMYD